MVSNERIFIRTKASIDNFLDFSQLIESKKANDDEQRLLMGLIRRTMHQNIPMKNGYHFLSYYIDEIARGLNGSTPDSIRYVVSQPSTILLQSSSVR